MTVESPKPDDGSDDGVARRATEGNDPNSDAPTQTVSTGPARNIDGPGAVFGRYRLLQQIGQGGFGAVYMAEQKEPVKRKVALKIIKLGMDTKQVIARFEAERQALAMMDHPNIARVLDAGATETGRPFFVMELVKGVPFTEYCDTESLPTRDRLHLFIGVCRAVQHAHQKGIIHRDLKPSNVMVTLHDGKPVPKVIDFGIAKATNRDLTDKTLFTEYHQLIGTPAYMSPEQAEMSGLDLDTRSDIYSLGVLLYELLTGTTPFSSKRFRGMDLGEIQHVIREEEPQKPSTRLSDISRGHTPGNGHSGADSDRTSIQYITKHRRTDIAGLRRDISGDLDWIIMKCLEKDRSRRYDTAEGLARDVERHLSDEPVSAGPPSKGYRLRKAIRRNRGVFVGVAFVFAALLVGAVVSTTFYFRTEAQRRLVDEERLSARVSERRAKRERDAALVANREVETVITVLAELLAAMTPENKGEAVSTAVGERLKEKPQTEARVRAAMIATYAKSGRFAEVEQQSKAIMAIDRQERQRSILAATLPSMVKLADTLLSQGRHAAAEVLYRQALEIQRRVLGEEHPDTLASMNNLANRLYRQGQYAEAEKLHNRTLEIKRRVLGEEHPDTLMSMTNLVSALYGQGRYAAAEELLLKTLEIQRRVLGEEHPDTLRAMMNLANAHYGRGRYVEAEELYRKTLDIQRRVLDEEHPDTLMSMLNMAIAHNARGRYAEAEALIRKTLDIQRRVLGEEHPDTLASMVNLAGAYAGQRRYAAAEDLYRKTIRSTRRSLGNKHQSLGYPLVDLAESLLERGEPTEARDLVREALAIRQAVLPDNHDHIAHTRSVLGECLTALGQHAEAEPLLLRSYVRLTTVQGESGSKTRKTLNRIIKLYESWDATEPGKGYAQEAANWRAKLPADNDARAPEPTPP